MEKQGKKRQVIGTVVSDKMDKTIVVLVETLVKHRLYQKYIKRHTKFKAHDKDKRQSYNNRIETAK
jgi:small subunit ribosomal protein S17